MLPDEKELSLDVESVGGATTVRCGGRLTLSSAGVLRHRVKGLLPHTRSITLDFTSLTLIDSVGLGTVAALYASAHTSGCELYVVNISPRIREMFTVTRLLSLFEPYGNANIQMP